MTVRLSLLRGLPTIPLLVMDGTKVGSSLVPEVTLGVVPTLWVQSLLYSNHDLPCHPNSLLIRSPQEPWKEPLGLCALRSEFLFFKVTLTPSEGSLQTLWPAECQFSRDKKTVWFGMTQLVVGQTSRVIYLRHI